MSEQKTEVALDVATVSDRGLSEKRPVNEDSFLSDPARGIFAVADGVGGAQAGEVASKTAVEVLDEAFRHHTDGVDIEDLMEIAIQRANSSIHKMAQDHPKLAAMATTIVALHLDGRIATIGHVGDSRLYRLSPEGKLHRETADHSVVEEEVRAGRMTPEQAAHHPSRNVISRALGAESGVEVDMKTVEVDDGTIFLLCSDGITRHIPDNELRELLANASGLNQLCAEVKRICFERGAEDNLTAVIVRVGANVRANGFHGADDDRTVSTTRHSPFDTTAPGFTVDEPTQPAAPAPAPVAPIPEVSLPARQRSEKDEPAPVNPVLALKDFAATNKRKGGAGRALLLLLLMAGIGAAAFYGGMYFQRERAGEAPAAATTASPTPTAAATPTDLVAEFERKREQVDKAPAQMARTMREERAAAGTVNPLDSTDPEFLYLYGRALLLMGDNMNAMTAFERAGLNIGAGTSALHDKLKVETRLAAMAAALRLRALQPDAEKRATQAFDELINKGISPTVSQ